MAGSANRLKRWGRASIAAVLVAIALLAGAAPASAEPGVWGSSSHPSVSGRTQIFYGAIADRRKNAWAIGYSWGVIGGALEFRTLAQRWNGFSVDDHPDPRLRDGAGAGPDLRRRRGRAEQHLRGRDPGRRL